MKTQILNTKFIEARKSNNPVAKNLFSTLKGEFENLTKSSKDSPDAIIEKLAKKLTEAAKMINNEDSKSEIELLKEFLPLELTSDEVHSFVEQALSTSNGNKNIGMLLGSVMKLVKPTGKSVDVELVKKLINEKI